MQAAPFFTAVLRTLSVVVVSWHSCCQYYTIHICGAVRTFGIPYTWIFTLDRNFAKPSYLYIAEELIEKKYCAVKVTISSMQYLTRDKMLFLAKNFYYRIMIFWDAVQDSFYGALLNFVHSLWVGGEWSWLVLCEKKFFMSRTHMHACILCMRAYMQHVYKYTVIYALVLACTHVHQLTHGAFMHPPLHTNTELLSIKRPLPASLIVCPTWCIYCVFCRTGSFMSLWRSTTPLSTALKQGTNNN